MRSYIERIERLEAERADLGLDIREIKAEAKAMGFDLAAINEVLRRRRIDPGERAELDRVIELYLNTLAIGC